MSGLARWLGERRPAPPGSLAERLHCGEEGGPADRVLAEQGCARLGAALAAPGRVRASAFLLLEADALLTYACEAALEADAPEAALRRILAAASR